jgi:hypothetical protein
MISCWPWPVRSLKSFQEFISWPSPARAEILPKQEWHPQSRALIWALAAFPVHHLIGIIFAK